MWLFVVFVLTSSYTASLSSMLTVQRIEPDVMDVEWLKATKSVVGCDGDSFVRKYLENVIKFEGPDIKNISNQYQYPGEFQSGNISAAFLELPYEKVFINQFCKNYTASDPLNRFGGLGFVSSYSNSFPFAFTTFFLGKLLEGGTLGHQMYGVAQIDFPCLCPFSPKKIVPSLVSGWKLVEPLLSGIG